MAKSKIEVDNDVELNESGGTDGGDYESETEEEAESEGAAWRRVIANYVKRESFLLKESRKKCYSYYI
jgi:hypothetical protein